MKDHEFPSITEIAKKAVVNCKQLTKIACWAVGGSCQWQHCMSNCSEDGYIKDVLCKCGSHVAFMGQTCHSQQNYIECAQGKIDMRNLLKGAVNMIKDGTLNSGVSLSADFKLDKTLEAGLSNSLVGFATAECQCPGTDGNSQTCAIGNYCMNGQCFCIPYIFSKERCNCASEFFCNANSVCNLGTTEDALGYSRIYAQCYEQSPQTNKDKDYLPNYIKNNNITTSKQEFQDVFIEYGLWKSTIIGTLTGLMIGFFVLKLAQKIVMNKRKQ